MPNHEQWLRTSLWFTIPLNVVGVISFAWPEGWTGQVLDLPTASPIFRGLVSWMIALFGGMYLFMAQHPQINRGLLLFGAIGKIGVFLVAAGLLLFGQCPPITVAAIFVDFVLGVYWLYWLRKHPGT